MVIPPHLRGVIYMLLSGLVFVFNDSLMKLAVAQLPPYEVLVLRGISGTFFALALLSFNGELKLNRSMITRPVVLRAGFECVAILTYIIALANAPIGDVTAIFQTTPLLVFMGMIFIHKEAAPASRIALVVLGFIGALLVAQPGEGTVSPLVMLAFVTAFFAALRDLAARQISADVPALISTLFLILVVMLAALVCGMIFEQWILPPIPALALGLSAGLFMMLGHHFTLLAYRNAPAQTIAPFYYSFMVFAVVFGYFFFGDKPNLWGVCGMALIVMSGLAIIALDKGRHAEDLQDTLL